MKEFISSIAPDTSWLLENIPSPPLDKILKRYLPPLPSRADACERVPDLPKDWRRTLKGAVESRHKIVHGRLVDLDQDQLERTLDVVLELLYFLDQHAGYAWASERRSLSDELG